MEARVRRTQYYDKVIGRLYAVPPRDVDRFFLRMLLLHVPNVESFTGPNGLKPSEAVTWRAAAELRGLVPSSREYHEILEEAVATHMPTHLRSLFVQLLAHCEPSEPRALWDEFHEQLADDFILKATSKLAGVHAALHAIDLLLHSHGKTTDDVDLPRSEAFDDEEFHNRQLRHALDFDSIAEAEAAAELASQLNVGQ